MMIKKKTNIAYILFSIVISIVCCVSAVCFTLFAHEGNGATQNLHSYDEWVIVINPTCTDDGLRERYCSCGEKQEDIIASLGHELITVDKKPATCTEAGYETHVECSRCGFSSCEEITALGHNFGEWEVIKDATCTSFGLKKRTCFRDEPHFEIVKIDMKGHTMSDWEMVDEANCIKDGEERRKCSVCHLEENQPIKNTGHISSEWLIEKDATCTDDGIKYIECLICSLRLEEGVIESKGHLPFEWIVENEPTCEDEGSQHRKCKECGEMLEIETIDEHGHDFKIVYTATHHILQCTYCKTVESNEPHLWDDNDCKMCGYDAGGVKRLHWIKEGDSYILGGMGEAEPQDEFVLPSVYNGRAVTSIGNDAFRAFTGRSVIIPSSVTNIAFGAFYGCSNLEKLTIPFFGNDMDNPSHLGYLFGAQTVDENLKYIPSSLATVEISDGITKLSENAFRNCINVREIILPSTLEVLGDNCFRFCTSLKNVILPENLKFIGMCAFWACESLESIVIPAAVEEIGFGAFHEVASNCKIVFRNKSNWYLFDGEEEKISLDEDFFADETKIIESSDLYTYKRKTEGMT